MDLCTKLALNADMYHSEEKFAVFFKKDLWVDVAVKKGIIEHKATLEGFTYIMCNDGTKPLILKGIVNLYKAGEWLFYITEGKFEDVLQSA